MSTRTARLGDICDINPRAPKSLADDATVSFLSMSGVAEGGFINEEQERAAGEVRKGYSFFERGDVLVAKITPCFENGKATRTSSLKHPAGFGSTEFHVLRASKEVSSDYLFYAVWNSSFREWGAKNMTGSAGQKRVPTDFIRRLEIPLPPFNEQRRIAAILDKADALRRKRKRALELLDGLTQSMFVEIFGDPIENTRGYPTKKLSDLVDNARGISYGIVQRGDDLDDGVSVIRISDFQSGKLDTANLKKTSAEISNKYKRTILRGGELVISIRGTVGRCAAIPNNLSGANVSREVAVIPTLSKDRNNFYLALLRSSSTQRRIAGDIKGVAQSGINLEDLRELEIIQPSNEDMKRFNTAMHLFAKIETHQAAALLLAESQFQALQHSAFSVGL